MKFSKIQVNIGVHCGRKCSCWVKRLQFTGCTLASWAHLCADLSTIGSPEVLIKPYSFPPGLPPSGTICPAAWFFSPKLLHASPIARFPPLSSHSTCSSSQLCATFRRTLTIGRYWQVRAMQAPGTSLASICIFRNIRDLLVDNGIRTGLTVEQAGKMHKPMKSVAASWDIFRQDGLPSEWTTDQTRRDSV